MPTCPLRTELWLHALIRYEPDTWLINVAARLLEVDLKGRARA